MNANAMVCAVLCAVSGMAAAGELFVEPGGLSPKDALRTVREAKRKGDRSAWTIHVKGRHVLDGSLTFTPADSGEPNAPVAWVGADASAELSGGAVLTGWTDDGDGVWSAPIPKNADGKPVYFEQLWVNERRAARARLPDAGYFRVTKPTISPVPDAVKGTTYVQRVTLTNSAALALAKIPAAEFPYAQMCVIHKWEFARRILRAFDPATLTVSVHSPSGWANWQKWSESATLVSFENVRSAFDAPGEWFYDQAQGRVRYRPMKGERIETLRAVAPTAKASRLVEFKGDPDRGDYVHDVIFRNIAFTNSDAPDSSGNGGPTESWQFQAAYGSDGTVTAEGARRVCLENCTIRHTGNYGIRFNDGCVSNRIVGCRLEELGAGGIFIGASKGYVAEGETLSRRVIRNLAPRSTAFNLVEDCTIRGGGHFNPEGTGVALTHVSDTVVRHCDIEDMFYTGISVGWIWGFTGSVAQRNEIAFNRISNLGKGLMSDMGGVYTLGTSYGTWVHDNVIHDVWPYTYGGWALYADEGSEGIVMERNLCWNTSDGGFHQHYGTGCIIRNNIFAWNKIKGAVRTRRQEVDGIPCSLHFVNNIVVVREGPLVGIGPRGVSGVWAGNLWYDYSGNPVLDGLDWAGWEASGKEVGGAYADPRFANADANDFTLRPESPAFRLGFKAWDWSQAGCRRR